MIEKGQGQRGRGRNYSWARLGIIHSQLQVGASNKEPYLTGIKLHLLWNEYEQFIEVEHRDEILAAKEQFRQTFDMTHERCHCV